MAVDLQRAEALFTQALEHTDPVSRAAFLTQVCSTDAELYERVLALLAAHEQAGSFLKQPALAATAGYQGTLHQEMILLDRYQLLERLGEGGMGEVWVARQSEPVKRNVAIKFIKAGLDSRAVLARFEQERQALAVMDHPNIARVFDGGLTATGTPFFVMELVAGLPLNKYCDEAKLSVNDRLQLFVSICQAVQHAHQKGIVHRDLKPGNILVTLIDGKPTPKIIDFGVAKAISNKLIDQSLSTQFGAVIGTMEYMAPEQAGLSTQDVDTRADIYSLGVILFEMLTGLRPIDSKRLKQAALDEMIRIIREEEAPSLASRLSTEESLPNVAAVRQIEPRRLLSLVKGELDWIVHRCLEKDRNRRYDTANGLARDVQRYLANEPVEARPVSVGYRVKKFVRRNRGAVIAASIVLLTLIGGIVGTTWGLIRADYHRKLAEVETVKAETAEGLTLADYRASTDDAIEHLIGSKPELGPQEKTYLEKTLERWKVFANRQGDDKRSRAIRGEGHHRVAILWQRLFRMNEAQAEFSKASEIRRSLVKQYPDVPAYREDLAVTCGSMGILFAQLGKRDEARVEFEQGRNLLTTLNEQFPTDTNYQSQLAIAHHNLAVQFNLSGNWESAEKEIKRGLELRKKLHDLNPADSKRQYYLALSHRQLGVHLDSQKRSDQGLTESMKAQELLKKLNEKYPTDPVYIQELAGIHNNLGVLFSQTGKHTAARIEYSHSIDYFKKLVELFPSIPQYQYQLAVLYNNLGLLDEGLGKRPVAQKAYESARDIFQKLVERYPKVTEYQLGLGCSYSDLGVLIRQSGKFVESLEWSDLAIKTLLPIHLRDPHHEMTKQLLCRSYESKARAHDSLKKNVEAVEDWSQALAHSPNAKRMRYIAWRTESQIRAGMYAEAVADIEAMSKSSDLSQNQFYSYSRIYAIASSKITEKKQEYADRAMELLQQAVKAGYQDADHIAKETDFDPLRGREDFKKLLADLSRQATTTIAVPDRTKK